MRTDFLQVICSDKFRMPFGRSDILTRAWVLRENRPATQLKTLM